MKRALPWLAAALLLAAAPAPACMIVYGSGRNTGSPEALALWNEANKAINAAVAARLEQARLEPVQTWLPIGALPPAEIPDFLVGQARSHGCRRIVDTAVFESTAESRLIVRLRVHPLVGGLGPQRVVGALQIGDPIYSSQRDFEVANRRALEPARLAALADLMVEEYLRSTAEAAAPSQ